MATVERGQLAVDLRLSGTLEPFATVRVAAESAGRLVARKVEQGDRVERGQLLFQSDSRVARLQQRKARHSLGAAAVDAELALQQSQRGQALASERVISAERYDQLDYARQAASERKALARVEADSAQKAVRDASCRAPREGTIAELHAELGDWVLPGQALATLVDLSRLKMRVGLTADEATALQPGLRANVHFAALGGQALEAELHHVSTLADVHSGTYAAELWLTAPEDGSLRPGMVGRVELPITSTQETALLPRAAVDRAGGGFGLWVVEADGPILRARRRSLTVGRSDARRVQALSGVREGERVVIEGMFALAEGDRVVIDGAEPSQQATR
ncbi:MAG: efflux RND transporter periplasmic adaptor subunit [Myxococcales bacterium]|nr:efflux RND transporter periplasmic adaptor subunit [Myxococcales bacterium]